MKRLWSPWRYRYITGVKPSDCAFCQLPRENNDKLNLVLHRGERCYIMLNLYPYINGHLMVIPYQHLDSPLSLPNAALTEMMLLNNLCISALTEAMHPDGFNIGMNLGKSAGAGIKEHIHLHVVPRWTGDNNFMSVLGETRVISQSLDDCYNILLPIITRLSQKN
ncbi:MAG: HIT domain-containing protein [Chloroflexi bacterium]|nr:HIT domain-containing protein [Chloroflexota bacterium]